MNRRTQASLLAFALLLVAVAAMSVLPAPWVVYRPGPTLNVLGEYDGMPILDVDGHPEYRDDGSMRLLTIITTGREEKVHLLEALGAWLNPHQAVYPHALVYPDQGTEKADRAESQQQMSSSQDNARAAALTELGIAFDRWVEVTKVEPKGGAAGELAAGDRVVAVNGTKVTSAEQLFGLMQKIRPGRTITVRTSRKGVDSDHRVRTKSSGTEPVRAVMGIGIAEEFRFPFRVAVNLDERIGGPSAGLMFSVAIYDVLTKGSLTRGKEIAGTGEVDSSGRVGPIGGIQQKIAAAQRDKARLFLVPRDNCREALATSYDADRMRLVRADTVDQAIEQIKKWAADPHAELTECSR